jgi:hypothetical protein
MNDGNLCVRDTHRDEGYDRGKEDEYNWVDDDDDIVLLNEEGWEGLDEDDVRLYNSGEGSL